MKIPIQGQSLVMIQRMHTEVPLFCSQDEIESRVNGGSRFLLVAFVSSGSNVTLDFSKRLLEFTKTLKNLDTELVFVDVYREKSLALSHRISISPTLLVFDSGSRALTQICDFDFEDLKNWLQSQ